MITALAPKISQSALVSNHALGFVELMHLVEDAKNKRLISSFYAINTDLQQEIAINNKDVTYKWRFNTQGVKEAIDFINSLYTETFTIETRDDIKPRIKVGARYTHQNGLKGTVISVCYQDAGAITVEFDDAVGEIGAIVEFFSIFALKGATVTQKRGDA